jgi:hypothetical protein
MMRGAERQQVLEVVPTSVGPWIQVMDVDEYGMPTARHRAAAEVSPKNSPADGERNGLRRPALRRGNPTGRSTSSNTHVGQFLHSV